VDDVLAVVVAEVDEVDVDGNRVDVDVVEIV
jgi:hypothetical protein